MVIFALTLPVIFETLATAAAVTIVSKAASDLYDAVTESDDKEE